MRTSKCVCCGKSIEGENTLCAKCKFEHDKGIITKPEEEELLWFLLAFTYKEIAELYRVSDNTVRAWAKSYNIPHIKTETRHYVWNRLVELGKLPNQKIRF